MLHCPDIQNFIQSCMLAKHTPDSDLSVLHSVTLVPRLEYSVGLLSETIMTLCQKQEELRASNRNAPCLDGQDYARLESLELEKTYLYCHKAMSVVRVRLSRISSLASLTDMLPTAVLMIRAISAQLYEIFPDCSQKLSELSVHLGSIALDSAVLSKAKFDFDYSNKESISVLDEVKLIASSKINEQYPNVELYTP